MLDGYVFDFDFQVMYFLLSFISSFVHISILIKNCWSPLLREYIQTAWLMHFGTPLFQPQLIDTEWDNLIFSPRNLEFEHSNSLLSLCLNWRDIWGCSVYRKVSRGGVERLGLDTTSSQNEKEMEGKILWLWPTAFPCCACPLVWPGYTSCALLS